MKTFKTHKNRRIFKRKSLGGRGLISQMAVNTLDKINDQNVKRNQELQITKDANVAKGKIVSLIVSHNSRIQCFLDNFLRFQSGPLKQQIRFMNCCVLRLEMTPQGNSQVNLNIQLVYEGELGEEDKKKKRPYYVIQNQQGGDGEVIRIGSYENPQTYSVPSMFGKKTSPSITATASSASSFIIPVPFPSFNKLLNGTDLLTLMNLKISDIQTTMIFYLIRHGNAEHNNYSQFQLHTKYDTNCTPLGMQQAKNAGKFLGQIMKSKNESVVDYLFCSDLIRTRQTMINIYLGIQNVVNITIPKNIIILPCASEVDYNLNGSCDSTTSKLKYDNENYPLCKLNSNDKDCGFSEFGQNKLLIDWRHYLIFYAGQIRSKSVSASNMESRTNRLHCRDTNFVSIAVYIIINQPFTNNAVMDRREFKAFIDNRSGKGREDAVLGPGFHDKVGGIKTKRNRRNLRKTRKSKK